MVGLLLNTRDKQRGKTYFMILVVIVFYKKNDQEFMQLKGKLYSLCQW